MVKKPVTREMTKKETEEGRNQGTETVSSEPAAATPPEAPRPGRRRSVWLYIMLIFVLFLLAFGTTLAASMMGYIHVDQVKAKVSPVIAKLTAGWQQRPVIKWNWGKSVEPVKKEDAAPAAKPVQAAPATQTAPAKTEEVITLNAEQMKNVSRLARLYEAMRSEEAAAIMNELDDDLIISIFLKMEEDRVAKIIAAMDPKRAARLTELMVMKKPNTLLVKEKQTPNPAPPTAPTSPQAPLKPQAPGAGTVLPPANIPAQQPQQPQR